ncbi:uncharacterized protein EV154DRAFT_433144 [Mucor mucedo]|uniref:uncharacterized protein n=1 Tax=Mucor mucedo TaxID=29922 RepID=UPI00221ED17A|nr:uncharacterized protein EV154DRAFT_433144 [Mucor mucedo]KAI7864214.1 hypothetical protein EV154DRAFT_433144 [Mucor mucedo]
MNEYGCGRGPRIWTYTGLAIRMAIEIGLHKEKVFEEGANPFLPLEKWYWYETRRKVFWETLMHDKFTSAATGKPSVLDPKDCEIMLPVDLDVLDNTNGNDFYQASLDKKKLIHYHIVRDEMTNLITGIQMNPLDTNLAEHRVYLNRVGWTSHILHATVLLGKVSHFINSGNDDAKPFAMYENNLEFEELDNALDAWVKDLPLQIKNTPANLERYRNSSNMRSTQYVLGHILHNSLVVLLHRPSLVVADLPGFNQVTQETHAKVHKSLEKCLSAANDVTVMIKDLCCQIEMMPPFISYSVYTTATVVVNNIFTHNAQENKLAEAALKEYFRFLSEMKIYWAMSDKLYLMICDLYAIHQKVVNTCQNSQMATTGSTNSSGSWNNNNNNDNAFLSTYPSKACVPITERTVIDAPPTNDAMKNQQGWNTHDLMFQTNDEQGRGRSIFTSPSNTSVSAPSFDVWLRQQQQNRSSS